MTYSVFFARNLVILYIAVQSLEPCLDDTIVQQAKILTLSKLFKLKSSSLSNYTNNYINNDLVYCITLLEVILKICSEEHIQKAIGNIIIELGKTKPHSTISTNYMKRFEYQYYQMFEPYIVGNNKYQNYDWIKKISLINLFLLEKLPTIHAKYKIILYLLNNKSNQQNELYF